MVLKQLLFFNLLFLSFGRAEYVMSGKLRHQHKVGQWQQHKRKPLKLQDSVKTEMLFYPQCKLKIKKENPQSNKTLWRVFLFSADNATKDVIKLAKITSKTFTNYLRLFFISPIRCNVHYHMRLYPFFPKRYFQWSQWGFNRARTII